jgi:hypothetical protein
MALVKVLHQGGISRNGHIIKTFTKPSRQKLIYELNTWFFDYFYAGDLDVQQLPPLDDWTRAVEDPLYWSIQFPDDTWSVWITQEVIEF